jgi:hypothetical protein
MLTIRFTPTASGTRSGVIEVRTADGSPSTIDLQGTAVGAGQATLDSTAVRFEDTHINATSKPKTVVVTNVGESELDVTGPIVSGDDAGDFSATGCRNVTLAPGKTCNITVAMKPTAVGARSAQLAVGVSDGTGPTEPLTGTGTASSDLGVTITNDNRGFGVTVVNRGPDRANDIVVTVNLTGGTLSKVVAPCTKVDDTHAACRVAALDSGGAGYIPFSAFTYNRDGAGDVVVSVQVRSTSIDSNARNNSYEYVDHEVQ